MTGSNTPLRVIILHRDKRAVVWVSHDGSRVQIDIPRPGQLTIFHRYESAQYHNSPALWERRAVELIDRYIESGDL